MSAMTTRHQWGAARPARTPILDELPWAELDLHHSAGPMGGVEQVRQIQKQHLARGWRDIAYNTLVCDDGPVEGIGIGVQHLNVGRGVSGTICAVGDFHANPVPPHIAEHIAQLVAHGFLSGWWPPRITHGHRNRAATACPGDHLYAAIPSINARAAQILAELTGGDAPTPSPTPIPAPPALEEDPPMWFVLHDIAPDGEPTSNFHWIVDPAGRTARYLRDPGPWIAGGFEKRSVPFAGRVLADLGYQIVGG